DPPPPHPFPTRRSSDLALCARVSRSREGKPRVLHRRRELFRRRPTTRKRSHPREIVRAEDKAQLERVTRAERPAHRGRFPGEERSEERRVGKECESGGG